MSWGEAVRLTQVLATDPSSQVGAALNDWTHPASWEALALMDLYDLQHRAKAKRKPPAYPRPWGDRTRRTFGRTSMDRAHLRVLLDTHRDAHPDAQEWEVTPDG